MAAQPVRGGVLPMQVTADSAAFRALRNNEPYAKSKHSKFELQRAVAAAEKKLMNWRRSADKAFQEQRAALDKVLQEEQRLETAGAAAVENLEELRAQVGNARADDKKRRTFSLGISAPPSGLYGCCITLPPPSAP